MMIVKLLLYFIDMKETGFANIIRLRKQYLSLSEISLFPHHHRTVGVLADYSFYGIPSLETITFKK